MLYTNNSTDILAHIIDKLVKSHFANDIEQFWRKIRNEPGEL